MDSATYSINENLLRTSKKALRSQRLRFLCNWKNSRWVIGPATLSIIFLFLIPTHEPLIRSTNLEKKIETGKADTLSNSGAVQVASSGSSRESDLVEPPATKNSGVKPPYPTPTMVNPVKERLLRLRGQAVPVANTSAPMPLSRTKGTREPGIIFSQTVEKTGASLAGDHGLLIHGTVYGVGDTLPDGSRLLAIKPAQKTVLLTN